VANTHHPQGHPVGLLEAVIEPSDGPAQPWWRRFIAALRSVAGSRAQIVEELHAARVAASAGGRARLEEPSTRKKLTESEIIRNMEDARLKVAQAERERSEADRIRIAGENAAKQGVAEAELKAAQAEKLRAEAAKVRAETQIALNDAAISWLNALRENGYDAVPVLDDRGVTVVITDRTGGGRASSIRALPDEVLP
jgi:hypothetical protein